MPEHTTQDFSDRRPEHTELEPSTEELLSDLEHAMDKPFTPEELRRQSEVQHEIAGIGVDEAPANREPIEATLNKIEAVAEKESREQRWLLLSEETRQMFDAARQLYVRIGFVIPSMKRTPELVRLSGQAREVRGNLDIAYNAYLGEIASEKSFSEAVGIAYGELQEINRHLTSHSG